MLCLALAGGAAGAAPDDVAAAERDEPRIWRTADDLPGDRVIALSQSADGYLWVGTAYGLARFDGFRFSVFDPARLGVANLGNVILEPGVGNTMWIGTERGDALEWNNGKITNCLTRGDQGDAVLSIHPEGAEGAVILKTKSIWRWNRRTGARSLATPGPLELLHSRQGLLTVRTARDPEGGLYFFAREKCWKLTGDVFTEMNPALAGIDAERLWDAYTSMDGTAWLFSDRELLWRNALGKWTALPQLGTGGLYGYILGSGPGDSIWMRLNDNLRLASKKGWLVDAGVWPPPQRSSPAYTGPAGCVWFALSTGVLRCVRPDGTVREFPGSTRIPENKLSRLFLDREGNLWGGTNDSGLVCWNAARLGPAYGADPSAPPPEPETHLESCRLGDLEIEAPFPPAGLVAAVDTHRLEFTYTGILLNAPESVRFRYRLQGLENSWRESTSRHVSYTAVPGGRYRFEVQSARAGTGRWSSVSSVAVLVRAPFWRAAWFRVLAPALVTAAAGLAGWGVSRRRASRRVKLLELERIRSAERQRLARDLHDDLGSRLTHLALVADLAEYGANPDAGALHNLQSGLREAIASLDEIVWAVDPRRDTLPDLAEYLVAVLTGFFRTGGIVCEMESAAALPALRVPPDHRHHLLMAVREAAQNILKHSAATRVILRWSFDEHAFRLSVADNGRGFDPDAASLSGGGGDGLRNMRERLAACGGECRLSSSPGEGCLLTFQLPVPVTPSP